jgi:hypothetical protein
MLAFKLRKSSNDRAETENAGDDVPGVHDGWRATPSGDACDRCFIEEIGFARIQAKPDGSVLQGLPVSKTIGDEFAKSPSRTLSPDQHERSSR